jgi:pyruvate dehydrogenase E2 component (dihydrolipoamide acetyltransferase)
MSWCIDFELPSSVAGVVRDIHVQVGEKVRVGQLILTLEEESQPARETPPEVRERPAPEKTTAREASGEEPAVAVPETKPIPLQSPLAEKEVEAPPARRPVPATPTVRRLARELGVSIEQVPGSGPAGRILGEDVKNFVKRIIRNAAAAPSAPGAGSVPAGLLPVGRSGAQGHDRNPP